MGNFNQALRGAAAGATGFLSGNPYIGAATTAAGFLTGFFESNPEDERRKRKAEYLKRLAEIKKKQITQGTEIIGKQTAGITAQSRQAAARRAASLGVEAGDVESFVLPAESQATVQGSRALQQFLSGTEREFSQAELEAEAGFADRPIEPNLTDTLLDLGSTALNVYGANERAKALTPMSTKQAVNIGQDVTTGQILNAPVSISKYKPNDEPFSLQQTLKPLRKPTNLVDSYRYLMGR